MKTAAIFLIALGIVMIAYTGFTYVTAEKLVDLGPIQINQQQNHPVQWSPVVGGILLLTGIVILVLGRKKTI